MGDDVSRIWHHSLIFVKLKLSPVTGKNKMLSDVKGGGGGGWRVSECCGRQVFIFFIKENWICAMTRHHAEPNVNISLTRNLPFDSDVRQWGHPLMIPLHCLWAKSNNTTRGQFECDMTSFCFCFDFVCSDTWCGCCSVVCLRFQDVQIKQVDCKMSTKK